MEVESGTEGRVRMFQLLVVTVYYTEWFQLGAIIIFNIVLPTSPEFLSSLLLPNVHSAPISFRIWATTLSASFQAYILLCFVQIAHLFGLPMILFMFAMTDLDGKPQRLSEDQIFCTTGGCTKIENEVSRYRSLQLLTNEFDGVFAPLHGAMHGVLTAEFYDFYEICQNK